MRRQAAAFFPALVVGLALAGLAAAAPVYPPGLRIGLEPAAGLAPARGFPGFADAERNVSVTILELPGAAYDQVARSTFSEPEQGIGEVRREIFPFAGGFGFLASGRVMKDGSERRIWFLLSRPVAGADEDMTALVRVEVPAAAAALYSERVVRDMLASVTFRPEPVRERLGLLPFRLTDLAGFRVSRVSNTGVVILTEGASDTLAGHSYAVVSIGRGAPDDPKDYARFARQLLASAPIRDLAITSGDAMRINGQPGFELRARGADPKGAPVALVQWLRFSGSGYIRVVAVTPQKEWEPMFPRFRALRDGIELR